LFVIGYNENVLKFCMIGSCIITNVSSNFNGWNGDTGKSIGLRYGSNNSTSSTVSGYVPECSMHSH